MTSPVVIDYFSDVLCVWAWIAQRRNDELEEQWGDQIALRPHYLNLFGNTASRMQDQWQDRGGYNGFGQHVIEAAAPYIDIPLHPEIWTKVRPTTSANAHLVIKAAAIIDSTAARQLAVSIRKAFFEEAMDIGILPVLFEIAEDTGIDLDNIKCSVDDGRAAAALMSDYTAAQQQQIKGSPSWVLNHGRQKLYGNIGYRVLHANVEGLLSNYGDEASWC